MAHFWHGHVSSRGATGCRTCAHPGKRIWRVPSSFPSVWSSECQPAWCTYTSPLQESTRLLTIYQKPSCFHLCWPGLSEIHEDHQSYRGSLCKSNIQCVKRCTSGVWAWPFFHLIYQKLLWFQVLWNTGTCVVLVCRKTLWQHQRNPWSSWRSSGLPSSTCLWDYRLRHTRI